MFKNTESVGNGARFLLKRVSFAALSFVLCASLFFSSCSKKGVDNTSTQISNAEISSAITNVESEVEAISSSITKTEVEIIESSSAYSSSEEVKQEISSTPVVSKTESTSVSQGDVAQTGLFDVYAQAENWTYSVDKSKPVPLQPCVDNGFFSQVMFVGDSITTGIDLYDIVNGCSVVAFTGINTSTILSKEVIRNSQGNKVTFLQAMSEYNPKHIFIMLGINGISFQSKENFISGYRQFVDAIKAQHPNSIIYLQSILPVTNKKQTKDPSFSNSKINSYNDGIAALALEKDVYYLNVAEAFKDANGNLPANASSDGVHFGPAHYRLWIEYLKRHTVYTGEVPEAPIVSVPEQPSSNITEDISSDVASKETTSRQLLISRPER